MCVALGRPATKYDNFRMLVNEARVSAIGGAASAAIEAAKIWDEWKMSFPGLGVRTRLPADLTVLRDAQKIAETREDFALGMSPERSIASDIFVGIQENSLAYEVLDLVNPLADFSYLGSSVYVDSVPGGSVMPTFGAPFSAWHANGNRFAWGGPVTAVAIPVMSFSGGVGGITLHITTPATDPSLIQFISNGGVQTLQYDNMFVGAGPEFSLVDGTGTVVLPLLFSVSKTVGNLTRTSLTIPKRDLTGWQLTIAHATAGDYHFEVTTSDIFVINGDLVDGVVYNGTTLSPNVEVKDLINIGTPELGQLLMSDDKIRSALKWIRAYDHFLSEAGNGGTQSIQALMQKEYLNVRTSSDIMAPDALTRASLFYMDWWMTPTLGITSRTKRILYQTFYLACLDTFYYLANSQDFVLDVANNNLSLTMN
jgi:hypothetical protein